ncbi:hypothetical protein TrVE_jg4116 [Triparma verrucosa]|uniref:Pseudouridine synthase RsuA/RluA-like domain-containing protein n=1 Tax=Triparma verrucosa TaxID=1606542 RepID=A0A9W7CBT9_9STRA|nr:hypothetical protein TrVE_jg4116 [Triparma verrucosa]
MVKGSIWTSFLLIVFIIMMLRQTTSFLTRTTTQRTKPRTTRSLGAVADDFLTPFAPPSPFPYPRRIPVPGTDKTLKVCYTDYDSLVVVSKPPGLLSVEGASGCSENAVSAVCQEFGVADVPRAVVHRLDMETSGLLIVALRPDAQRWLYEEFREKRVKKTYSAVVMGTLSPHQQQGESSVKSAKALDSIIDKGPWQDVVDDAYLSSLQHFIETSNVGVNYMKGVKERAEKSAPGVTRYESEGLVEVNGVDCTRIKLFPHSGRTHQLRVFCRQHLNRAILGDRGYMCGGGAKSLLDKTSAGRSTFQTALEENIDWNGRMCLHAGELSFRHRGVNQMIHIQDSEDFGI